MQVYFNVVAGNKNVPVRRLSGHDNDSYDIGPMENLFPQNTHVVS